MKASIFNHDKVDPKISGNTYTWELRDLPRIEKEEYSPALSALAPRIMVSYFPPAENRGGTARAEGLELPFPRGCRRWWIPRLR